MAGLRESAARRRTDSIIRHAFVNLLSERTFESITVRELCAAADIDRATFYRYYPDLFALRDTLTEDLYKQVYLQIADINFDPYESGSYNIEKPVYDALCIIKENRLLCKALISDTSTNGLFYRISRDYHKYFTRYMEAYGYVGESADYLNYFALYGISGLVNRWLANNCSTDPKLVAQMINRATWATYEQIKQFEKSVYA